VEVGLALSAIPICREIFERPLVPSWTEKNKELSQSENETEDYELALTLKTVWIENSWGDEILTKILSYFIYLLNSSPFL